MEDSTECFLQSFLTLSTDTFKDSFFRFGVNISYLPELKKCMGEVGISQRWGKPVM